MSFRYYGTYPLLEEELFLSDSTLYRDIDGVLCTDSPVRLYISAIETVFVCSLGLSGLRRVRNTFYNMQYCQCHLSIDSAI